VRPHELNEKLVAPSAWLDVTIAPLTIRAMTITMEKMRKKIPAKNQVIQHPPIPTIVRHNVAVMDRTTVAKDAMIATMTVGIEIGDVIAIGGVIVIEIVAEIVIAKSSSPKMMFFFP
jgi:hypothetical protein